MKKVLAIVGSNSTNSINRQLTEYASEQLEEVHVEITDLTNFDVPMYSIIEEQTNGFPKLIAQLYDKIQEYDAYIIASPEHNGLMPAVLKNTIDWLTRVNGKFLGDKPVLLLSTSPGPTGGANNLKVMSSLLPWWGGNVVGTYSLGSFMKKFDTQSQQMIDINENSQLTAALNKLKAA